MNRMHCMGNTFVIIFFDSINSTTSNVLLDGDNAGSDCSEAVDEADDEHADIRVPSVSATSSRSTSTDCELPLESCRIGSSPIPKRKRKIPPPNDFDPDNILKVLMQRATAAENTPQDHIHDFLIGYASTLKRFPPVLLAQTKRKIANIICDAEITLLESKQTHGPVDEPRNLIVNSRYTNEEIVVDDEDIEYIVEEIELSDSDHLI